MVISSLFKTAAASQMKKFLEPEISQLDADLNSLSSEKSPYLNDLLSYALASKLGPSNPQSTRDLALAVELIHIATLIHDDVIDKAVLRRGVKTVVEKDGVETALLLGDYILSIAFKRVASIGNPFILQLLTESTSVVCEGEMNQLHRRFYFDLREDEYFTFIQQKTAALFGVSARCGAVLSGQSNDVQEKLAQLGIQLGMAFQIQDDLLDLLGQEKDIGKTLKTDVLNGKMTLPLIYFRDSLKNKSDLNDFIQTLKHPNGRLAEIVDRLAASASVSRIQSIIQTHFDHAFDLLQTIHPGAVRDGFGELIQNLSKRKK